jgi:hypothetical protein
MPYSDPDRQRAFNREWIQRRRVAWFAGKSCVQCGSTESLELDHIDPETKVNHRLWSWSAVRREAELAKCQILCRPCHQAKSLAEMGEIRKHGSIAMYIHHKCRCTACRAANAAHARRQRAAKKLGPRPGIAPRNPRGSLPRARSTQRRGMARITRRARGDSPGSLFLPERGHLRVPVPDIPG